MSKVDYKVWSYEFRPLEGWSEKPSFTKAQVLPDGNLVLGAAFGHPFMSQYKPSKGANGELEQVDLDLESVVDLDALGVFGGFHMSETGDVDVSVAHSAKPGALKKLFSGDFSDLTGAELVQKLDAKGNGSSVSSTHLQWTKGKFNVRRAQDPGLTWDIWFLGDYVFGVTPSVLWRERYLHLQIEKREVLRKDLLGNFQIHRDGGGSFWSFMENGLFARFEYTETRAKPTTKKLPGLEKNHGFERSISSETDKWLYGVSGAGTELFRVRRNAESFEEEIQSLWTSESPITAITSVDSGEKTSIVVATESEEGARLYSFATEKPEDVEALPEIPTAEELGHLEGVPRVSCLTWDWTQKEKAVLWGAEGYLGSETLRNPGEKLRILRISLS